MIRPSDEAGGDRARARRRGWAPILASYAIAFAALAAPLFGSLFAALPAQPNPQDADVITWVLAWVAHALTSDPARVFDANVGHPAPAQLAGTDHLFGAQALFLPLFAATANPVLSANLTALLTYPLAALAMNRLVAHAGVGGAVAWWTGLCFALGFARVPFNLHVLIVPCLLLPWVARALDRLRERPGLSSALALLVALTVGAFASGYAAVLVATTATIWALVALARPLPSRERFLGYAAGAALAASAVLLWSLRPYLALSARVDDPPLASSAGLDALDLATGTAGLIEPVRAFVSLLPATAIAVWIADVLLAVASIAVALDAYRRGGTVARRLVPIGLALAIGGALLSRGYPDRLLPWIAWTPLPFFRFTRRFLVMASFGEALLLAAGLAGLWERARTRVARFGALAAVAVLLLPRAIALGDAEMWPVAALAAHAPVYEAVGAIVAREGDGPLLELPLRGRVDRGAPSTRVRQDTLEPESILASTRFWWRTPASHLSYQADHRWLFLRTVAQLPDADALDELIDMTHVRWLLVRPAAFWRSAGERGAFLERLAAAKAVGGIEDVGGWALVRLDRVPAHQAWYDAIARGGGGADRTVLGTPLAPLDERAARAVIDVDVDATALRGSTRADRLVLTLVVRNAGDVAWPATPRSPRTLGVMGLARLLPLPLENAVVLAPEWRRIDGGEGADAPLDVAPTLLRRDVDPGEAIVQRLAVPLPSEPGRYELEVRVRQEGGAGFRDAENRSAKVAVLVDRDGARVIDRGHAED